MINIDDYKNCVGKGWWEELVEPFLKLIAHRDDVTINQIKEKFGGLRIYIDGPEFIGNIIESLMESSYKICEDCGRHNGWAYGKGLPQETPNYETTRVTTEGRWRVTLCQWCREKDLVKPLVG